MTIGIADCYCTIYNIGITFFPISLYFYEAPTNLKFVSSDNSSILPRNALRILILF